MSNEVYVYFDIYNHTNQLGVSSYALPFCQYKFVPHLEDVTEDGVLSNTKILWVYGDGSTSRSLTGVHAYANPGTYQVYCYLYDNDGNAYLNTYVRDVIVSNYITDKISLAVPSLTSYALTAGRIEYPITVTRNNSYQSYTPDSLYTITPYASGSNLPSYFDGISSSLYGHLELYQSFYIQQTTAAGINEFVETNSIITDSTPIYACLTANQVIQVDADHPYAFFCGTSGSKDVYYKSDMTIPQVNLLFGFDTSTFDLNTSTVGLSTSIAPNTNYEYFSFTTNGIDGEGYRLSSFNHTGAYFKDGIIPFVAKVKDRDWFTVKDCQIYNNTISISQSGYYTNGSTVTRSVSCIKYTTHPSASSWNNVQGYVQGYFVPLSGADKCYFASVPAISSRYVDAHTDIFNRSAGIFNILGTCNQTYTSATSAAFGFQNFTASAPYVVAKQGEYVDMTQNYKDLRFQELFLDKNVLFDDFIGSIVGGLSSTQNSIGKKVYEKIENFVDNTSNLDKCNVAQLVSLLESVGDENVLFEKSNFNFPSNLKRLIDLLSIKHSKLFGAANTFDLDFYNYGTQYLGKNLGSRLDTLTYNVSAGHDIVALEKYSSTFKKLNTYIPLSAYSIQQYLSATGRTSTYPLSTYADSWGWGLILNSGYTAADIDKYYIFFEHVPTSDPVIYDSTVNFEDFNTTLPRSLSSYNNWVADNGYIDNMIAYQLALGLNLVDPLTGTCPLSF